MPSIKIAVGEEEIEIDLDQIQEECKLILLLIYTFISIFYYPADAILDILTTESVALEMFVVFAVEYWKQKCFETGVVFLKAAVKECAKREKERDGKDEKERDVDLKVIAIARGMLGMACVKRGELDVDFSIALLTLDCWRSCGSRSWWLVC
jgi:hypothetical protein